MIISAPAATPVTMPLALPMAALVLLLLQAPPPPSVSVIVCPTHTDEGPLIAEGSAFTVIIFEVAQPVDSVYTTVTVPVLMPVKTPPVLIVPVVAGVALHTPPASDKAIVLPRHTAPAPVIDAGIAFTVTTAVAAQPGAVV